MKTKELYLAGGCFWGMQAYFTQLHGVMKTEVGYANGHVKDPTYDMVCHYDTGHAETLHIQYDPHKLSLPFLLTMYYDVIDPTSKNRQGNDVGSQYRPGIYYVDSQDEAIIKDSLAKLQTDYTKPIVVECEALRCFYSAEAYHQEYLKKHPNGYCHISWDKIEEAGKAIDRPTFQKPSPEVLKQRLNDEQYAVTQQGATERPFQNAYWDQYEKGIYVDITTGEPLFVSSDKFSSGCGWPSFSKPIDQSLLQQLEDRTHGMRRIEVKSMHSDAHLGHVFDDGPKELGGLRYCINSASLRFIPYEHMKSEGYQEYLYLLSDL